MTHLPKYILYLLAFCVLAITNSHSYYAGVDSGIHAIDQQAFDAAVGVAEQVQTVRQEMRVASHKPRHKASTPHETQTVWNALEGGK